METWAWLLAYVVAFGLLQLVLFRYFQREDHTAEATPSTGERRGPAAAESGADGRADATGVCCRHCGTMNEQFATFAFCRVCVRPLN